MTDDLPVFAWGESVTWNNGRLRVPLNRDGETVADLEMGEDEARLLADMLTDAVDPEPELSEGCKRTCAAGIWMDGHVPPDDAIELARGHWTECRDGDQAGLDQLDDPDARAKVTYWRGGKQITAEGAQ